ncbi:hypothetical protein ACU4GD_43465 [Cupriavidus basilensis]
MKSPPIEGQALAIHRTVARGQRRAAHEAKIRPWRDHPRTQDEGKAARDGHASWRSKYPRALPLLNPGEDGAEISRDEAGGSPISTCEQVQPCGRKAHRQPAGSSFKPFIYSAALEKDSRPQP